MSNITDFSIKGSILEKYMGQGGEVVIPEGVTGIGQNAFRNSSVTSVVIPDSVTSIGSWAFYSCKELKRITIPEKLTRIGSDAFEYCNQLKEVCFSNLETWIAMDKKSWDDSPLRNAAVLYINGEPIHDVVIPENMASIPDKAFLMWVSLRSVIIPDGVTRIGDEAFDFCRRLTSVVIPEGVTEIGKYAFSGCTNLTSLAIPESLARIGENAFLYCDNLKEIHYCNLESWLVKDRREWESEPLEKGAVLYIDGEAIRDLVIPEKTTNIADDAFSHWGSLTSVTIPGGVKSIGMRAFQNCKGLTSVTIQEGVTGIGKWVFDKCVGLKRIILPESLTVIGFGAFNECKALEEVHFSNLDAWLAMDKKEWQDNPLDEGAVLYIHGEPILDLVVPETMTQIPDGAFENWNSLKHITIPEGVTQIGQKAFHGCGSLTDVTIPASVTCIGEKAFSDCGSLTSVTIPAGVTCIVRGMFSGCYSLEFVTIPASVTSIGDWAFSGCASLVSVTVPQSVTSIGEMAFSRCKSLTNVALPDSVTAIGEGAFEDCYSLTEISIPKGLTVISKQTFSGCSSLESLTIPNSITGIAQEAFYGCKGLKSVIIPESVTFIYPKTFERCAKLENVTLPDTVTVIGKRAFCECKSLAGVKVPDSVTVIGEEAFYQCGGLTSVMLGSNVRAIGRRVFYCCVALTDISFPESLKSIGDQAFEGCENLKSVTFANNNVSIGKHAFASCDRLTNTVCTAHISKSEGQSFIVCKEIKNIFYPDAVCTLVAPKARSTAALTMAKWIETGKPVSHAVYHSYCNYFQQNRQKWVKPVEVRAENTPLYRWLLKERIFTKEDTATLITLSTDAGLTELTSMLLQYQNDNYGQSDFEVRFNDAFPSLDDTLSNKKKDADEGWVIDRENQTVLACERTPVRVVFPTEVDGVKIVGIADEFAFRFNGKKTLKKVKKVTIPEGYRFIGAHTFEGCSALAEISLPTTLMDIGEKAFSLCTSLESIVIPERVNHIGSYAFSGVHLKELHLPNLSSWCRIQRENVESNPTIDAEGALLVNNENACELVIPDDVKSIADRAFARFKCLTSVKFPDTLEAIGKEAFYWCSGIREVTIPSGTDILGEYAFRACSEITSVRLLGRPTKVGGVVFTTARMERVEMPYNIALMKAKAFSRTEIRNLIVHDFKGSCTDRRIWMGSNGAVMYTDQRPKVKPDEDNLRIRGLDQLQADMEKPNSLAGLTFVATGDLGSFPEPDDFYEEEFRHYAYKDWEETGDYFEGYEKVKKYPKYEDLKAFIEMRGGRLTTAVSGKTNYLIYDGGKEYRKQKNEAKKKGKPIITSKAFLAFALDDIPLP